MGDQDTSENTNETEDTEEVKTNVEEASHAVEEEEEDDGNVEVSLDDSQTDEWSLEKEGDVEVDSEVTEVEKEDDTEKGNDDEDGGESYRKTPPALDTAAAITNILSEIVGGESDDSRAVVGR